MPEYTALTVLAVVAVVALDDAVLRTRLIRTASFWISLAIMWSFQVLVDGWLTKLSSPIVRYDADQISGLRLFFDSPVEDFGFGFAMILLTLSVWDVLGSTHRAGAERAAESDRGGGVSAWNAVLLTVLTMAVMEPVAAAVHRFFGHGPGWSLHRDHHDPRPGPLEHNDAIPATFAVVSMTAFWVGLDEPGRRWLFWVALGVTLYGLAYALVHDVYIHRRLPLLPRRVAWLEPWRRAHLDHHRSNRAPFGVLVPLRPRKG